MHSRFLVRLLTCVFLTSLALRAQAPATAPVPKVTGGAELILVAKVTGIVTMTVNGATTPLAVNNKVLQSAKITTAKESSIVLAFSNGATTQLGAETELVIEEFLQDPFATMVKMADITDEPSVSTTKLKLNHGELVGKVAHLKHDQGSTFVVETPVGAAGIRGTTFRIVFRPNGTGQAFFQLSTIEGNVAFGAPGTGGGTATPGVTATGTANVAVPQGQEISVNVDVTVNAQGVTVVTVLPSVSTTSNISPAVAAQVNQVAADIAVATQQAVFTPAAPAGGGTTGGGTAGGSTTGGSTTGGSTTGGSTTGGSTTGGSTTGGSTTGGSTTGGSTTGGSTTGGTAQISGANFTGTVTQPPPRITTGDGKSG